MARRWGINKKFLWPVAILALAALVNFTPLGRPLGALGEPAARWGGGFFGAGRATRDFWQGLTRGFFLQKELSHKEAIISELAKANADLHYLEEENRNLRDLLALQSGNRSQKLIPAEVIWIDSQAERSLLTISRGRADGLKEKLPVVAGSGVFIGKIASVAEHSAVVVLTTDRASAVAATSARDPNLQAIVKGKMGLSLSLELIPQDAQIESGDIIITSVLEENTPAGLPLGRVAGVYYKEGELFKRANLEPLVTVLNLRAVAVLAGDN